MSGYPTVTVRCKPSFDFNSIFPTISTGSNHIKYEGPDLTLRLSSDISVSYILNEVPFTLFEDKYIILSTDESLSRSLNDIVKEFQANTRIFWCQWCKTLNLPFEYQKQVIRAAMAINVCKFEESGCVLLSMTSSIPNAKINQHTINSDQRYCWLKDSFFYVKIFSKLAMTGTLEDFIEYLVNIVKQCMKKDLLLENNYGTIYIRPRVFEREALCLAGYNGNGPVMIGQPAFSYSLDEINGYGSVLQALIYSFYDARLSKLQKFLNMSFYKLVVDFGNRGYDIYKMPIFHYFSYLNQAKQGVEERKNSIDIHIEGLEKNKNADYSEKIKEIKALGVNTYSLVALWSGFKSLAKLSQKLACSSKMGQPANFKMDPTNEEENSKLFKEQSNVWEQRALEVKNFIYTHAWCPVNNTFCASIHFHDSMHNSLSDKEIYEHTGCQENDTISKFHNPDGYLLLYPELGFITVHEDKFKSSLKRLESLDLGLKHNTAQIYWYINVLYTMNEVTRAREMFENSMSNMNDAGLMSSTIEKDKNDNLSFCGNIPDSSALTHFIYTAFKISKTWDVN